MNYDKTFKPKYHHNLLLDKHSKMKKGRNDDDDDNDTNIFFEALRSQMIVTTMSFDLNIQILPLIILLSHESQKFHNHKHMTFYNVYIGWIL